MFTFTLTLVRHGETLYNRDRLLQGQGVDATLSETGVQQAEAAGRYLRDIAFHNVFVSNMQRAVQTAEAVLRNNAHRSDAEMVLEPLLRERSFGVAEGHPKDDLKKMASAAGQACHNFTPPGGETLDQVKRRFQKFLASLFGHVLEEHGCSEAAANGTAASNPDAGCALDGCHGVPVHVLVVSHGAYIRVAIKHLISDLKCSLPVGAKPHQLLSSCPNTGISRFVLTLSPSENGPVLTAAQCIFTNRKRHLEDLTAEK